VIVYSYLVHLKVNYETINIISLLVSKATEVKHNAHPELLSKSCIIPDKCSGWKYLSAVVTCLCIEYTLNRVTAMMQMPTILHAAGVATRPIGLWYQE